MAYGLRFRTVSLQLGTSFDWFIPNTDSPEASNSRGYDLFRDVITTPGGNTFLYDKGTRKSWNLEFRDISELSKNRLEHCSFGWFGYQQITMVYFGTSVIGTTETAGSMATAGQLWGTCFLTITGPKDGRPEELELDLWNVDLEIKEFGSDQSFT